MTDYSTKNHGSSLDSPPSPPIAGELWYNYQAKELQVWDEFERRWIKFAHSDHIHVNYEKGGHTHLSNRTKVINVEGSYIEDYIQNIKDAAEDNKYTLLLGPGRHELNETLELKPYISLMGVDREHTELYSDDASIVTMVQMTDNTSLSNLTLVHSGMFVGTARMVTTGAASENISVHDINAYVNFGNALDTVVDFDAYDVENFVVENFFLKNNTSTNGTGFSIGNATGTAKNVFKNGIIDNFERGAYVVTNTTDNESIIGNIFYNCTLGIYPVLSTYITTKFNVCIVYCHYLAGSSKI